MLSHLLQSIPSWTVCLFVGLVIMTESLGIPIPGETVLVASALLAAQHQLSTSPLWIAIGGSLGAAIGDSIGFAIGQRYGDALFDRLARRFPKQLHPDRIEAARRMMTTRGAFAVFFGRFIALLRIFAGPLAGSMGMPYLRFLVANVAGAIAWATATTYLVYELGAIAGTWLTRLSWIGLVVAVVGGLVVLLIIRHKTGSSAAGTPRDEVVGQGLGDSHAAGRGPLPPSELPHDR